MMDVAKPNMLDLGKRLSDDVLGPMKQAFVGKDEVIDELTRLLKDHGNKTIAQVYLDSGHKKLADAAADWARRHKCPIACMPGRAPLPANHSRLQFHQNRNHAFHRCR